MALRTGMPDSQKAGPERRARVRVSLAWQRPYVDIDFRELSLGDQSMEGGGVYVIFHQGRAHRVGQATRVRERLRAHQNDPLVVGSCSSPLSVAWALVPRAYRDGVETFLGATLRPEVAQRFPTAEPVIVNLPTGVMPSASGLRALVMLAGGGDNASPSASSGSKVPNKMDEKTTLRTENELLDSIETLAYLHKKDAKNSPHHSNSECAMCTVFGRIKMPTHGEFPS